VALREYGHNQFRNLLLLAGAEGCDRVIINGDLADQYNLPLSEALEIYETMDQWLQQNPNKGIILACGNHDLSKDSSRLGTVEFVGALLGMKYFGRFSLVAKPEQFGDIYVVPHLVNQDLLELELSRVPEGVKYLLLHLNWDNRFAAEAEHSLNLDRAQAKALKERGITMILGHEHQGRESLGGKVVVVGSNFPSSIADCMPHGDGQKDGTKRALIIEDGTHRFVPTWTPDDAEGWFARVDWRELKDVEEEGRGFVRVEGDASEAEAADVIKAISAFRQRSRSFVVANAVKVEQAESLEDIAASIEDIRNVSVLELLLEQLDDAQQAAVRKLLGEAHE
jgi:DNA repair exonuclease SbcCD nuclease subunit